MNRIVLILMTILGLNAANVPGSVGEAIKNANGAGTQIASLTSDALSKVNLGAINKGVTSGLNIGKSTQASILGGLGQSVKPIFVNGGIGKMLGGAKPINVAKIQIRSRSNNRSLGFSL